MILGGAIALTGLLVSLLVTWTLVTRTGRLGLDDVRDAHRKFHHAPVSRLGGLGVVLAYGIVFLVLGWLYPDEIWSDWWPVALTSLGFFALGFIDDLYPLGAKRKLLGQMALAIAAYCIGLRIVMITTPAGDASWSLGGASLLITVLWLIAIPNIINLIDGMDGLATGLGVFVSATLGAVLFASGQQVAGLLCLGMMAALLGFLIFNFPPAKIYLGDGGAYFLGAFIATHSMNASQKGSVAAMFFVVLIALGLPILDTTVAILRRGFIGLPLFHADANHVHHYLQRTGISKRRTLVVLYTCCVAFCLIGLTIFWSQGIVLPTILMASFLGVVIVAKRLELFEQWAKLRAKGYQVLKRRHQIRRAHAISNYLMHELKHCETNEEFGQLFDLAASRLGFVSDQYSSGSERQRVEREMSEAYVSIKIDNPGNPMLRLFVPAASRDGLNWRLMAECLYPPFVAAQHHFNGNGGRNGHAHRPHKQRENIR